MDQALYTHWHEVVTDDIAFEIIVSYTARPGTADTWEDPGDAPEFDIQSAVFLSQYGWADFPLTADDHMLILSEIAERHEFGKDERDPDDWRDYHIDNARLDLTLNEDALIDF